MNKAILVMNEPTYCVNCPLLRTSRMPNTWVCGLPHNNGNVDIVFEPVDIDSDTKPDWCPLKPAPRMRFTYIGHDDEATANYNRGWNDCLEKIKGE